MPCATAGSVPMPRTPCRPSPPAQDSPETDPNPLLAADLADRVTFTPHSAAQTVEAVDRMGAGAAEAVRAVLRGRNPDPALVGSSSQGRCFRHDDPAQRSRMASTPAVAPPHRWSGR